MMKLMEALLHKGQLGHTMVALTKPSVGANPGKGNGVEQAHSEQ